MDVWVHVCMDVWMYDAWIYGCMYLHVCIDAWMCVFMYVFMYVCMHECIDVWVY